MSSSLTMRLNKYISDSGICSRREADKFIEDGKVTINGRRASLGDRVAESDRVTVNGNKIAPRAVESFVLIALNKPVGIVSTTESSERNNIVSFLHYPSRIFPIGRLDKDSQGLIFLTNDGDLVNKILRAGNNHEKEYVVTVNKVFDDKFLEGMRNGVPMLGEVTKKCKVERISPAVFKITLVQGLNRQIRRMCEHFGYEVTKLERVKIMNITLKGLGVGEWRDFTTEELTELDNLLAGSRSEPPKQSVNKKPKSKTSNAQKVRTAGKPAGTSKKSDQQSKRRNGKSVHKQGANPRGNGRNAGGSSSGATSGRAKRR